MGGNMTFIRTLKMMKITKMMRMTKALSAFKDLKVMMLCIVGSLSALFWCFVMLVFSLFFIQGFTTLLTSGQVIDESDVADILLAYGSVSAAMLTLYQHVTG